METKATFQATGMDTPILEARLLLQHVLNKSHERLLLDSKEVVNDDQLKTLSDLTARRVAGEPISRMTGMRGFWKYDFKISPETLDPRQDSETVIEAALKLSPSLVQKVQSIDPAWKPDFKDVRVLDLGTGSGCLLLSLLGEWAGAKGVGLDISAGAIATANENGMRLGFADRATFLAMDWNAYTPENQFDIVISNPPYIAESERAGLADNVLQFDPPAALFAGEDGLDAYRSIIALLPKFLKTGGWVLFEIGHKQAEAVTNMLAKAGFGMLQTFPDLAGNDRVVVAKCL